MIRTEEEPSLVVNLSEVRLQDKQTVGGKNAALGELIGELGARGIRVPPGFATTVSAYELFLRESGVLWELEAALRSLDARDLSSLRRASASARRLLLSVPLPPRLQAAIAKSYRELCQSQRCVDLPVAVRSSATAEDLPEASFAGQQESFLHVRGAESVIEAVQRCMASLFTERALSYRDERGIDHRAVGISVAVQRMVDASQGEAGVIFSVDPDTGFPNVMVLQANYGLGETVVSGKVIPDEYVVFKPTLGRGSRPILRRRRGSKAIKCIYASPPAQGTVLATTDTEEQRRYCLSDDDVLELAQWTMLVEEHYQARLGAEGGVDIEWAKDGVSGQLFLLQARPETVYRGKRPPEEHTYELLETGNVLVRGQAIGRRGASGPVQIISDASALHQFHAGSVLVTDMTDPDWEPVMKSAAAIVTNRGGRTCHAAIVSRELGLPAVVGTNNATGALHESEEVTVDCTSGATGIVYEGRLLFQKNPTPRLPSVQTRVHIEVNIGNPEEALRLSAKAIHGVGLAREEFIIAGEIGIHPLALLHPDRLDAATREKLHDATSSHDDLCEFFIERLAEGVSLIAAAF
ncbi:MAG: phosphoenolpyruvate synthase, partial [Myxococcota bacterium]